MTANNRQYKRLLLVMLLIIACTYLLMSRLNVKQTPKDPVAFQQPSDERKRMEEKEKNEVRNEFLMSAQNEAKDNTTTLWTKYEQQHHDVKTDTAPKVQTNAIPVVVVACGVEVNEQNRMYRSMRVFLKSLALFNTEPVHLIFIMDQNYKAVEEAMKDWPEEYKDRLKIQIVPAWLPPELNISNLPFNKWILQKLFYLQIFDSLDTILSIDIDIIFFKPLSSLIEELRAFNSNQSMGFTVVTTYCHPRGLVKIPCFNSGMFLQNLTRMRNLPFNVTREWMEIISKYSSEIKSGDQDIFNAFHTRHPEMFKKLSLEWNFTWFACRIAEKDRNFRGVGALHGPGRLLFRSDANDFKTTFDVFEKWNLSFGLSNLVNLLSKSLEEVIRNDQRTACHKSKPFEKWLLYYPRTMLV